MSKRRRKLKMKRRAKSRVILDEKDEEPEEYKKPTLLSGLDIVGIKSQSSDIYRTENMKSNLIPSHPFSISNVGASGSGKTCLIVNMLLNKDIFNGYFQEIYLIGSTINSDKMYANILYQIPKKNRISNKLVENLDKLIEKFEGDSDKRGVQKTKRKLIIFEDVSSNKKLMKSASFLKCYSQNRHMNLSVIANSHKYKLLPRLARLNCSAVFFFPSTQDEIDQIISDHQPSSITKNEFKRHIRYAHTPTANNQRPFLYINLQVGEKTRYRKSLRYLIEL